jgi:hypothetical protein
MQRTRLGAFRPFHALALGLAMALATMPADRETGAGSQEPRRSRAAPSNRRIGTGQDRRVAGHEPRRQLVAVQVTTVVEAKNERLREIWVVPTDGWR